MGGTVLQFFSGKMDQEWAVSWSKTELWDNFVCFLLGGNMSKSACGNSMAKVIPCSGEKQYHFSKCTGGSLIE